MIRSQSRWFKGSLWVSYYEQSVTHRGWTENTPLPVHAALRCEILGEKVGCSCDWSDVTVKMSRLQ